ncbi:ABC transporter ATP-binding protein [bacterium]|nr:ABC transporter ATP-binding protein [bacterium]
MSLEVQIQNLSRAFGTFRALDQVNLDIRQGESLSLIGPDGAGKTTLLRILCGLLRPDSGKCLIAGKDVLGDQRFLKSLIGYMPQRFSLYPDLTVSENLRFFADLFQVSASDRAARTKRLLAFSGLGPFLKRKAADLSGGMKQKLALSCTLIHTPAILFLDEPTTGVDPVSRREFWNILEDLHMQGVTLLVTTPYMDEAGRCDRVALLNRGRILATEAPGRFSGFFGGLLFELRCEALFRAVKALRSDEKFDSVQGFGDRIHVAGRGSETGLVSRIRSVLAREKIQVESLSRIPAGIEDVFVDLIRRQDS